MGFLSRITRAPAPEPEPTDELRFGLDDYAQWFADAYSQVSLQQSYMPGSTKETINGDFVGLSRQMRQSGPIFALMAFRLRLFSQVRWTYQSMRSGHGGDLFSLPLLDILNADPQLNVRMIQDVDLAGNFYGRITPTRIQRLRPDWVQVIGDGPLEDYDTDILGYVFYPGGPNTCPPDQAEVFPADEIIHWYEIPDPEARWRGMSWLTPVIREIGVDNAATLHAKKMFENGATPNMIIKYDPSTSFENFLKAKDSFSEQYEGISNAYKTLHLAGGADATVVGANLQQLEFSVTRGKGESRLASAAGVPPMLVYFSEGMAATTYSNLQEARRGAADSLMHPLWVSAAGAIGQRFPIPNGARVWYDASAIPFLREDEADAAATLTQNTAALRQLLDGGFEPDAAIQAILSDDLSVLKGQHSGRYSVQLLEPGATTDAPAPEPPLRSFKIVRDEHGFSKGGEWVDESLEDAAD